MSDHVLDYIYDIADKAGFDRDDLVAAYIAFGDCGYAQDPLVWTEQYLQYRRRLESVYGQSNRTQSCQV